jgi:selenocysteine-specific elongation factor
MKEHRQNIMLGTAGHVDHGKTALVKLLTGCNTDTLAEERQRGMTIDLGFAPCRLADERIVGVVDVPGHVDFVRNMVAGAHGIDVVVFVVAADDGVMPQTREHLSILSLMGLRHGLVALTKIDLVESGMRELVVEDLRRLLQGTFLETAPICPLNNLTGEGYESLFDALNVVCNACEPKSTSGCFRVWVEDVFSIRGFGTVVTGIPTNGTVHVGDRLELVPSGLAGRVRNLQVYGADAAEGRAGECVALNLAELDHLQVRRGQVLCDPGSSSPVSMVEAELCLLAGFHGSLKDYAEVHLHLGTAAVQARVAMLAEPKMSAGQTQMVQLRLAEPLGIVPGDRFVIRAQAGAESLGLQTIGGGRVLDTSNVRLRRQKSWTLEALAARKQAIDDPAQWCELVLRQASRPLSFNDWARASRLPEEQLRPHLDQLVIANRIIATGEETWMHLDTVNDLGRQVLSLLRAYHQANPKRTGQERDALRAETRQDKAVFELVMRQVETNKLVSVNGSIISVAGWSPMVTTAEVTLSDRVNEKLLAAGTAPPGLEEVAAALKEPLEKVQSAARWLVDQGLVVRLDDKVFMHRNAIESGRQLVVSLFKRSPSFTTMEFRDALEVSRKYAVPLLDYFDKIRLTVRTGNQRVPGAEAKKLLA